MDPEASGGKDRQKAARRAFFEARLPPVRNSGAWLWPSHGLTYIATVTQISAYAEQEPRHPTIAEQADDTPCLAVSGAWRFSEFESQEMIKTSPSGRQ